MGGLSDWLTMAGLRFQCLTTPCHTRGHISFVLEGEVKHGPGCGGPGNGGSRVAVHMTGSIYHGASKGSGMTGSKQRSNDVPMWGWVKSQNLWSCHTLGK